MKDKFDVVFHTANGHVRCGPLPGYARAQEFIMSVDPAAFDYDTVEIVKHGVEVPDLLLLKRA